MFLLPITIVISSSLLFSHILVLFFPQSPMFQALSPIFPLYYAAAILFQSMTIISSIHHAMFFSLIIIVSSTHLSMSLPSITYETPTHNQCFSLQSPPTHPLYFPHPSPIFLPPIINVSPTHHLCFSHPLLMFPPPITYVSPTHHLCFSHLSQMFFFLPCFLNSPSTLNQSSFPSLHPPYIFLPPPPPQQPLCYLSYSQNYFNINFLAL